MLKNISPIISPELLKALAEKIDAVIGCSLMGISAIENIKDSLIWIAFIENDDKSIRVRLRSRFVPVNPLAEKYRGGGHECACGATLYSKEEMERFIADADALIKEYKENNEGWL